MYEAGDLIEDFTDGSTYSREILDPLGNVICLVIETGCSSRNYKPSDQTKDLLAHLNRK